MTLPLRRVVFWMHLVAGTAAALVILLMSVTGVLLAYEKQIVRWADGYHAPRPTPGQAPLPLDEVVARARTARPGAQPGTVTMRRDPAAPVEINFGRDGSLFVNAYTGEVLGSGSQQTRAFFRSVMEWHRWVAMKDARRALGKQITGISNLLFLFIVVSGFYLWWPRTWTWTQFRQVLWFRRGLSSKARDFNWHHVIGYWSLAPLVVIVWSGVVIGYPWASDLTYRMVGEAPPARPGGTPSAPRPGGEGTRPAGAERGTNGSASTTADRSASADGRAPGATDGSASVTDGRLALSEVEGDGSPYLNLETLIGRAAARDAAWTILSARIPSSQDNALQVTVDTGTGAQPQKKATLTLDRQSGAELKWEPFAAQSAGRQWRSWMRFVHTGEYYGLVGQTIAMVVTAGSVVLVWTGLALTWRRFRAWRARGPAVVRRQAA